MARPIPVCKRLYSLSGWTSYLKISWSLEVARFGFRIFQSLQFDRNPSSSKTEMPVKFQIDTIIITYNLTTLRLHEIGGKTACRSVNKGPA